MAYEIINNKRSKSVIRIVGNTATTIQLSELEVDAQESVVSASITGIHSSTDGAWKIYRGDSDGGTLIFELFGENSLPLTSFDISISNTSSSNLHITNSGAGGTLLLVVSKICTYSPELTGI